MSFDLGRLIDNTPLVRLRRLATKPSVAVYAKLEGQNPGGSVKDRPAHQMIRGALERGVVRPGDRLIEATSGNTGIALAMIARLCGLRMTLLMPEGSTEERVRALRAYGAELILTPANVGMEGSRSLAQEMVDAGEGKMLDQFANLDNVDAHVRGTGPEIWRDTAGRVTHFVSAMGTTGTIMGVSTYLKSQNPSVQVVGVQPAEGSKIPGIRRWPTEYLPAIYRPERVDRILEVSEDEATDHTRRLALDEGILAGMSSGGALAAALRLAQEIDEGAIVFIVCDRGDRYLSSDLFG